MYEESNFLLPRIKMRYHFLFLHVFERRPIPLGALFRRVSDIRSEIDDTALQDRVRHDVLQKL